MPTLDRPLRKVAQSVLRTFGTTVTLRTTAGTYDPATMVVTEVDTDVTLKGRLDNYTDRELGFNTQTQTGTNIQAGDRKLTLAALDVSAAPTTASKALVGGLVYDIVRVTTELATDQAAIYVLQLRR